MPIGVWNFKWKYLNTQNIWACLWNGHNSIIWFCPFPVNAIDSKFRYLFKQTCLLWGRGGVGRGEWVLSDEMINRYMSQFMLRFCLLVYKLCNKHIIGPFDNYSRSIWINHKYVINHSVRFVNSLSINQCWPLNNFTSKCFVLKGRMEDIYTIHLISYAN